MGMCKARHCAGDLRASVADVRSCLSAFEYKKLLRVGIAEAELAVKTGAVGGHQIDPLNARYAWGVQEFLYDAAAKSMAL